MNQGFVSYQQGVEKRLYGMDAFSFDLIYSASARAQPPPPPRLSAAVPRPTRPLNGDLSQKDIALEGAIFLHSAPYLVAGFDSRHNKRAHSYYNIKSRLVKTRRGLSSHLRQPRRHSFFPVTIQPLE